MKVTLLCVGKIKEFFFADAIKEYTKRLSRYCKLEITEILDEKTPDGAGQGMEEIIKEKESERIFRYIREDSYVITLEIEGKKLDSVQFSQRIEQLGVRGTSHIIFVIGGSLGLHHSIKKRANESISFSDMTFPHQLMRVILLEQIYRGFRILNKEPYHK